MSSRDMTINEIKAVDKNFGANHTIAVKGFEDGGNRITANYVLQVTTNLIDDLSKNIFKAISDLRKEMNVGFAQINARIDNLESRLNNLVAKNNLKE